MRGVLIFLFAAAAHADAWVQPFPLGACSQPRPNVGAYFSPEISPLGLTLKVDGQDCTAAAAKDFGLWCWTPGSDLARGRHTAQLEGKTLAGQPFTRSWGFTWGESASLQVTHFSAASGRCTLSFSAPIAELRAWVDGREVRPQPGLSLTYGPGQHRVAILALGQDGSVVEKSWTVGP